MAGLRVLSNILSVWINLVVISVIGFLLTPFLIHQLKDHDYGVWVLVISVIGYLEILNLGINTAIIRYLAKFHEEEKFDRVNEVFNTGLALFSFLAMLVVSFAGVFSFFFQSIFDIEHDPTYQIVFFLAGLDLSLSFIFFSFYSALAARQRFFQTNLIGTTIFVVRSILIVWFLSNNYGLLALIGVQIATNQLRGIIFAVYALRVNKELRINFKFVRVAEFFNLARYTIFNLLINVSVKINSTFSFLLIGYFFSPKHITFYSIAFNLIKYIVEFMTKSQRVLIPRFSQLEASGSEATIVKYFIFFSKFSLITIIPLFTFLIFYGASFINLWVGPDYVETAYTILLLLTAGTFTYIPQLATTSLLKGLSRHQKLAGFRMVESCLIIILCIALSRVYGLQGIALGNTIPMVIFNLLIVPRYACVLLGVKILNYYKECYMRVLLPVIALISFQLIFPLKITSYFDLALAFSVNLAIYIPVAYSFALSAEERKWMLQLIPKALSSLRRQRLQVK